MAWVFYDWYLKNQLTGEKDAFVDHDSGTGVHIIKIALIKSTYTPDRAADIYFDDAGANDPIDEEVTGTNYTQGGNACANPAVTVAANVVTFDADDPITWSQSGTGFANAKHALMYRDSTVDTTANLMVYNTFGTEKGNVDGDLTIQLDASGIYTIGSA